MACFMGLSGLVNFFVVVGGGRICGEAYPRRIYSYVLWAYFDKPTFLGGPICGGGAIIDFYGI